MIKKINTQCDEIIAKARSVYDYIEKLPSSKINAREAQIICSFMRNIETRVIILNDLAVSSCREAVEESTRKFFRDLNEFEKRNEVK